ncbi:unnamed protein product [Camellia sinensis]
MENSDQDRCIVPGAAATEIELARRLKEFSFKETGFFALKYVADAACIMLRLDQVKTLPRYHPDVICCLLEVQIGTMNGIQHKYEIVKRLQERKHICGMTGDGVNDAPALKKADIGIAVADATHAARGASDIVLTEPGLSVIISVVLTSRAIFQRMKNYTIYAVSITIHIVFGFMLIALIWKNNHDILKGSVQPSPMPDSWKLKEIFATGVVLGGYLALMTVVFFWLMNDTKFFSDKFGVRPLGEKRPEQMMAALYLQVSIVSQALIFVTRSRSWSFAERPGLLLLFAFVTAQLIATLIAVYAKWGFAKIEGCGWGWAGVIWLYSVVTYIPLDLLKFAIRYALSGKAWDTLLENNFLTAFTTKSNYGKEEREAQWATAQRTLHGLQLPETTNLFSDKSNYRELSEIAEQAKRRAEVASYTYSGEASEEFDRDDNTLTLIKPSPMPSKDIRSPLEVGSVHGGNNGVWNVDLEENKIE